MRAISLPDWAFYPLILLVTAGLIALALVIRPAGTAPIVTDTRVEYRGASLADFISGPGTWASFMPDHPGSPVVRTTSVAPVESANSAGIGFLVPEPFEAAVRGRRIRVSAIVRRTDPSLESLALAYFTAANGDSGWREIALTDEFEPVSFEWSVPRGEVNGQEWIGIWPDPEGGAREVIIRQVSVEILPQD
ncbi:hypothetical protein GCM10011367_21220 [Marinicauda pacifica]|uniref:Uncharacterized protein n=1 Tax=Marinicauda pacifica TaxID=1133559 RepID=A0A4S2H8L8_9PROT|nr:hypothetical protein [Marinicauda pacifica]TGY92126.1 hypothetical protein E5162_10685 [Marinicauda pacifica]GGE46172.1 hypothetical protein GCM10011367_21220 [Marinicauda pacifica]